MFHSWYVDITWLSAGELLPVTFGLPQKAGEQTPTPSRHSLCRWHTLGLQCCLPTKPPIWGCKEYFLKWFFLPRSRFWQPSTDFLEDLTEITDSKGRSYGDTLPSFPLLNGNLILIQVTATRLPHLKNVLKNEAAAYLLWKPNEETGVLNDAKISLKLFYFCKLLPWSSLLLFCSENPQVFSVSVLYRHHIGRKTLVYL